ncbi:MAG: hypothetical protein IBX69_11925 [Anaerolineales bacterium]|nr:hypothetical protein [Anaerolineales bacterium]
MTDHSTRTLEAGRFQPVRRFDHSRSHKIALLIRGAQPRLLHAGLGGSLIPVSGK